MYLSQCEMILHHDGRLLLLMMVLLPSLSQAGLFLIEVGEEESSAGGGCGRGEGERYGDKCYRLHLLPKRWGAAKYICSKKSKERWKIVKFRSDIKFSREDWR